MDKLFYECRIPKIDIGTIFYICCRKFNIEESPSTTFEDEMVVMIVVATPQDPEHERTTALRETVVGVTLNVNR